MAYGERIKLFRKRKGLNQKELGLMMGYNEVTADVRIAQYENERRFPREAALNQMAYILDVAPEAIKVPEIDNAYGLMHTLFALEDKYGLSVDMIEGQVCLSMNVSDPNFDSHIYSSLLAWNRMKDKLITGLITKEKYDEWRYKYPEIEAAMTMARINAMRKKLKEEEHGDDSL